VGRPLPGESIFLPDTILRALREEAEKQGTTPEALMVHLLLGIVSDEEKPRALLEAAETSLRHARSHAEAGEYRDAYRRLWSSVLLGIEAYALHSGAGQSEKLEDYWALAGKAAGELGEASFDAFYAGLAAYIASREELGDGNHFNAMDKRVASFLEALKGLVTG
jgi:hypothetical protein